MKKNIHVVPHNGKWAIRSEGSKRVSKTFDTKKEALKAGKTQAQKNKAELVIHNRSGKIMDKDSYGHDPFPPRDKKH